MGLSEIVNHTPTGLSRKTNNFFFLFQSRASKCTGLLEPIWKIKRVWKLHLHLLLEFVPTLTFLENVICHFLWCWWRVHQRGASPERLFSPPFVVHLFQFQHCFKTGVHCRDAEMLCSENQILKSYFQQQNHCVNRGIVPVIFVEKLHVQSAAILLWGVSKLVLLPLVRGSKQGKGKGWGLVFYHLLSNPNSCCTRAAQLYQSWQTFVVLLITDNKLNCTY